MSNPMDLSALLDTKYYLVDLDTCEVIPDRSYDSYMEGYYAEEIYRQGSRMAITVGDPLNERMTLIKGKYLKMNPNVWKVKDGSEQAG